MLVYTNYLIKDSAVLFYFTIIRGKSVIWGSISTPILVSTQWRHLVCFLRFDENLKVSVSQLFLPTTDAPESPFSAQI